MKTILVGIQPTGKLHIGHYLGVLKPAKELNETEIVQILVADYHALTTCTEKQIEKNTKDVWATLHSLKLNHLTRQTGDNKVLELFWKLCAQESVAKLTHLPQFKSKEKTVGMLIYPLLMAADIIYSKCTHVLVGEDQIPHLEYYREIARKHHYPVAEAIVLPMSRIMSIKEPSKKMSKSLGDEHCLYLNDSLKSLKDKLKKAPTTPKGIKNLKKISKGYGVEYDSKQNAASKSLLAKTIYKTHHD